MREENAPQKNKTLKEQGFYVKRPWRHCRRLALQRDNYLCQDCLARNIITTATEVHHIIPLEERPDLALTLSNLRSLCYDCHALTRLRAATRSYPKGVRVIKI